MVSLYHPFVLIGYLSIHTYITCIGHDLGMLGVVHSWLMDLGNQFEIIVHYLLIKGMPCLSHRDGFTMVSALVCMMHTRQDIMIHQITILHGFSTSRGY